MACLNFMLMKDRLGRVVKVPCGKCIECKKDRAKAWAFRLMCEAKEHDSAVFLTLTYSPENVPLVPGAPYPFYATLSSTDLQLFFKRLRFNLGGRMIKYYACGEYGSKTYRPHYHAIVFGLDFSDLPAVEKSWNQGFVKLDEVNVATVNYVAGYVQKKLYGSDTYPDMIEPPFSRMSKRLGFKYFQDNWEKIWKQGITFQGYRMPTPRYFYRLLEDKKIGDKETWEIFEKRRENAKKSELDQELSLSRRFGYTAQSDEKELFRLSVQRNNRSGAEARERLFENRSKI